MGRGNSQRLANNLLYGPRARGAGPTSRAPLLGLNQLMGALDQEIIPSFLRRALPGVFLTRAPSVYEHLDLPNSHIHEYRLARHGYEGEIVLSLAEGSASLAYQDSDSGVNELGPDSQSHERLLTALANSVSDSLNIDFLFNDRSEVDSFLNVYQSCSLRLGSLRYGDSPSQGQLFEDIADAISESGDDYLSDQLRASESVSQLLTKPWGREALGQVADQSVLCLEVSLNQLAEEMEWDAAR